MKVRLQSRAYLDFRLVKTSSRNPAECELLGFRLLERLLGPDQRALLILQVLASRNLELRLVPRKKEVFRSAWLFYITNGNRIKLVGAKGLEPSTS